MINIKKRTKYDLQNKLKEFISHIFILFWKSLTLKKIPEKGRKFHSRDKIPKSESTAEAAHAKCSSQSIVHCNDLLPYQVPRDQKHSWRHFLSGHVGLRSISKHPPRELFYRYDISDTPDLGQARVAAW